MQIMKDTHINMAKWIELIKKNIIKFDGNEDDTVPTEGSRHPVIVEDGEEELDVGN